MQHLPAESITPNPAMQELQVATRSGSITPSHQSPCSSQDGVVEALLPGQVVPAVSLPSVAVLGPAPTSITSSVSAGTGTSALHLHLSR